MNRKTILPFLLTLAGGMAVGSIHNAQMRGGLPGLTTPLGLFLIGGSFLIFVAGLVLLRYYDRPGSLSWGAALGFGGIALLVELGNLASTLSGKGSLAGWLFHEYLGLAAAILQFVKLLRERRSRK